jgi:predicted ATPase/transcriptional regulator with GAF, ATPase, and Fis domain/tRNA A-37 threonylcarbamoyl transferase component Bud32
MVPDYELCQELSRSAWFFLYRGRCREDGRPVLLKTPRRDPSSRFEVRLLEHEYEILQRLSLPGVVRVQELLRHDHGCCLVLEDRGGIPLPALLPSRVLDLDVFFKLAIQLATILAELHRREIIHKHLNPCNILLHPTTGEVWLADFSLASRTVSETPTSLPLSLLRSTLAYLSPEQTGRMNRVMDYRTDFYSLGVTFYELLTGGPPFRSDDALELIHCHIAKLPTPPSQVDATIPEPLSRMVMKLLAKTAEERYQSALGLRADLEYCAQQWTRRGEIAPFPLGQQDVSDRFVVPQHLYGREQQLAELLRAFEQTCQGRSAFMLVAGYAGIGKTTLIQELYKPLVRHRGYFIAGKFDQLARNVPYRALIQAFQRLVQRLLAEGDERLDVWRARLAVALGVNGGVLAEVLPEIELILGKQAPVPPLAPTEAQNRFIMVLQNFLSVLATPEHPLVIFLDDLQWVDSATLHLLPPLLTNPDLRCLCLIGAYRDNEVSADHPLLKTQATLAEAGAQLHHITLPPLELEHLTQLVRDSLHSALADSRPLAELLKRKTDGNPFFVMQFLKTLHQEGFITFDYDRRRWTYDLDVIATAAITDNVVDLMRRKLQRLTPRTQRAVTLAACVGNRFDLHTLAIVSEQTPEATAADLQQAIDEGVILPAGDPAVAATATAYTFLHDRVQQAAYARIADEQKHPVHLQVGRLLLEQWDRVRAPEQVFDIVRHLNFAGSLIADDMERLPLAQLNLIAGQRAKSSTAYQAALTYFKAGIDLLPKADWDVDYALLFALRREAAECEYLCGYFVQAEHAFDRLLERARTRLDKATIYSLKVLQYEHMSRYADAIRTGREGIALFGLFFPDLPAEKQAALDVELNAIQTLQGERTVDALIDWPIMQDAEMRAAMTLLSNLHTSCFLSGDKPLTLLNIATMVRLSLTHGNVEESAYAYVLHAAMLLGPIKEDYRSAYEFGLLALRLNERLPNPAVRAKVSMMFAWAVSPWRMPLEASFPYTHEAFHLGHDTGLFVDASWALFNEIWFALLTSRDLAVFDKTYTPHVDYSERIKMHHIADAKRVLLQWGRALQGLTEHPLSFTDATFDEAAYCRTYQGQRLFEMFYIVAKLAVLYTFNAYQSAHEAARQAEAIIGSDFSGTIWDEIRTFYHALTLSALYAEAPLAERQETAGQLEAWNRRLQRWAENSPHNFQSQHLIASAEIARVQRRSADAMALYEAAIEAATAHERPRERALAHELYARFWLERGQPKVAAVFMAEARSGYAQWGAATKVKDLERKYPDLLDIPTGAGLRGQTEAVTAPLDIATVMKAARAITSEIVLEDFLRELVRIAIENAGAQRGVFLQDQDGQLIVAAEGSVDAGAVNVVGSMPVESGTPLSWAVISYVRQTDESVVVGNALADERFSNDPYIVSTKPRSILCVPIVHHGKLGGILYLENNLAHDAFTADRIEMLRILSAQAAISLENAKLYEAMKEEVIERQRAEEMLRAVTEGTASVTGDDFFYSLVRYLASALQVRYAFVAKCIDARKTKVRTLAFWQGDCFGENFEYDVTGTPCLQVLDGTVCHYAENVRALFPHDRDLLALGAESYMGFPILNTASQVIGHLVVLDDKPMQEDARGMAVLQIFAARAGAELERLQAEEGLHRALAEVETLKNRLQAENVYLQEEIRQEHNFEEMVGSSPALLEMLQKVELVAPTDSAVLLSGETGTGKELVARALHNRSARKDRPLVKVNCGAISAGLVESELFGHVKGAFTGALERRVGRFELANGGTIFLDEVGELPPETQVKLLRVLQEQEFEPVGSSRTVRVDVRIIAATNRDLEEAVRAGRFRSDLFYRLNVFPIQVPPLRERRSDIPQLVMFFFSRFSKKLGKKIEAVPQGIMDLLSTYAWPGNIRELQNLIERAVVLSQGPVLRLDRTLLPAVTTDAGATAPEAVGGVPLKTGRDSELRSPSASPVPGDSLTLEEVEKRHILAVLKQTGGVIEGPKGAAKILKLHPNTLRSRIKKLGIKHSDYDIS